MGLFSPAIPQRTCMFCVQAARLMSLSVRAYQTESTGCNSMVEDPTNSFKPALNDSLPSLDHLGMTNHKTWKIKDSPVQVEYYNFNNYELASAWPA